MKLQAAIVETRELPNIREIVYDRHLRFLPNGTECLFFHSPLNYKFIKKELEGLNINFQPLTVENLTIEGYNKLLTSVSFWSRFNAERVLIFQHDSSLLRIGIEYFFNADYIGAPWKFQAWGGNGGLSLRNPAIMIKIINNEPFDFSKHGNEDIYFSNHTKLVGGILGNNYICNEFSCETIFKLGTFGYHAIEKYLSTSEVEQIKNQYN